MRRRPYPQLRNAQLAPPTSRLRQAGLPGQRAHRASGKRQRDQGPFSPPENWHEPSEEAISGYRVLVQEPGPGFRHVVSPEEVRDRLAELPQGYLGDLQVIQLSRMTRKKRTFPCYGMQWGQSLYLYPLESDLIEYFYRPPRPAQFNEARMYGGRWEESPGVWKLIWTETTIRDFYLNNVLIHELGHLLDDRNTSYLDRERFAEWFAIEYGYKASRRKQLAGAAAKKIVRRHHAR